MLLKKLTHPLYLLLIIIAIAIVINRDELFGDTAETTRHTPVFESTAEVNEAPAPTKPVESQSAPATVADAGDRSSVETKEPNTRMAKPPSTPAAIPSQPDADESPSEIWRDARQAAWEGRFEQALASYRRLVAAEPDNADALGEMGNVHLQLSDWRKAVDAYHESALLWQAKGDDVRAWHLQQIIAGLDWERGQTLGQRLAGNGNQKNE